MVGQARTDQHERRDALRRFQRQLERRVASERDTDDCRAIDAGHVQRLAHRASIGDELRLERRPADARKIDAQDCVRGRERAQLRLPHARVGDACVQEEDRRPLTVNVVPDAHASSSANSGRTNSSKLLRSQLATVAGVSARTDAVRGMCIASATSPK